MPTGSRLKITSREPAHRPVASATSISEKPARRRFRGTRSGNVHGLSGWKLSAAGPCCGRVRLLILPHALPSAKPIRGTLVHNSPAAVLGAITHSGAA